MGTDHYHCYLDTNTFLHYEFFPNIDWCNALNVDEITLIICYPVLKELEKHKRYHQNKTVRDRAINIVKKINLILDSGLKTELKKNVMLELIKRNLKINWKMEELSPDSTDDQIVAYVLSDKKKEKMIITSDPGLKLIAKSRDIICTELDDRFKLEINDKKEREIQLLKRQIGQKPKLESGIFDGKDFSSKYRLELSNPPQFKMDEIDTELNKIHESLLNKEKGNDRIQLEMSENYFQEIKYNKYQELIDDLVLCFKNYFKDYYRFLERCSRIYRLNLYIFNTGNRPAKNINVLLNLPNTIQLINPDHFPAKPQSPVMKIGPMLLKSIPFSPFLMKDPRFINLEKKFMREEKRIGMHAHKIYKIINKTIGSNQIENLFYYTSAIKAKYDKIQHKDKALLMIYIEVEKENVKSFHIECKMIADEIPEEVIDKIIVKIE